MRKSSGTAILAAAIAGMSLALGVAPAAAKTCKEPVTVTSRSTIQGTEDTRTRRATDNAQKKWSKEVQSKYGLPYYFWIRSDDRKVECRQTPKSTICTTTATPCRIL